MRGIPCSRIVAIVVFSLVLASSLTRGEVRTWTSRKGTTVEAEFLELKNHQVHLRSPQGRTYGIPLSSLSAADRAYVAEKTQENEEVEAPLPKLPDDFKYTIGKIAGPEATDSDAKLGSWSYWYYLPKDFSVDREWPILFVMSPGGGKNSSSLRRYVDGAEWNHWILVLSVESKNGFEGSGQAVDAMIADAREKFPVDGDRMYSSGFSGGSRMAFSVAQSNIKPDLAGVLACGAGCVRANLPSRTVVYGLCGSNCFNRWDMACTHERLKGNDHRLRFFVGRHDWAAEPLITDGMIHLNLVTLAGARSTKKGVREERERLADKLFREVSEQAETEPERAYDWLAFLSKYKGASPALRRNANTKLREMSKLPRIQLYEKACKDLDRFVDRHFATDVMDFRNNNGTPEAKRDSEKMVQEYGDTILAELFRKMGEPSQKP